MKKYRITLTKDNEKIVLGEKESKEEAMQLGNEMMHQYSEEDGILSCVSVDVDDYGNQVGDGYQLYYTWI